MRFQKALEEKEKHIEQLMAERELHDYSPSEQGEQIRKLDEKLKTSENSIQALKTELAAKKKEVDDLRFQIEEDNVTKECEIEELQKKIETIGVTATAPTADLEKIGELQAKLAKFEKEIAEVRLGKEGLTGI